MTHPTRVHVNREEEDSFGRVEARDESSGDEEISDEENHVLFTPSVLRDLEETKHDFDEAEH